jgi:hypothetical protein
MPLTTAKDLAGQRFGKLTAIRRADPPRPSARAHWLCRCECGAETVKNGKYLLCGHTRSCGCDQRAMRARGNKKYGTVPAKRANRREYTIWRAMKSRCLTPSTSNYRFYGARGITVCDRWRDDFAAFLADMGPCPDGYTLDRIDPKGHYEPANCRWASWEAQHRNTRASLYVELDGQRMVAGEAFIRLGIPVGRRPDAYRHLHKGKSLAEIGAMLGHAALP